MKGKPKTMTDQEYEEWCELYEYVRKDILGYDKNQRIPSNIVLRMKGLAFGKFIENRNIEDKAKYSFKVILYAFKINKIAIENAIRTKDFKNEMVKFIYISKIVEGSLNDVYNRVTAVEKSKEKVESVSTDIIAHAGAEYKSHSNTNNKPSKYDDLW